MQINTYHLESEQSELEARVLDFEREILRLKVVLGNTNNIIGATHSRSGWRAGTSSDTGMLIRTQLEQLLHQSKLEEREVSIEEAHVALVLRVDHFGDRLSRLRAKVEISPCPPIPRANLDSPLRASTEEHLDAGSSDCIDPQRRSPSGPIFKEGLLKKKRGVVMEEDATGH